jgi:hypothetical protein
MSVHDPVGHRVEPAAEQQRLSEAIGAIVARRAVIEQAKGMLMFVFGIDAEEAFSILRTQSQHHNVKLNLIAEQVLEDLVHLSRDKGPGRRRAVDGLVGPAHQRVTDVAARLRNGRQCKTSR